jgi:hypothetical protein
VTRLKRSSRARASGGSWVRMQGVYDVTDVMGPVDVVVRVVLR